MTALWVLWVFYCLAFITDRLYLQPYRRRRAAASGRPYEAGSMSFGLAASLPIVTGVLLLRTFVIDIYHVPTPSMEPNLKQDTRIFVDRLAYSLRSPLTGQPWVLRREPSPGDIIVFEYPREPRTVYVKRVLGVPGDRIRIDGERIQVNDQVLYDPESPRTDPSVSVHLGEHRYSILDDPEISSPISLDIVVPENHYFALGDNLNHSEDSRIWGFVATRHLLGRAIH
jgi:signal peptidase I